MKEHERDPALVALMNKAEQLDGQAVGQEVEAEPTAAEPAAINSTAQVEGLLTMAVQLLAPMFPSLGQVYTPKTINALASVTVPLANKYGWDVGGLFGRYAEEVAFIAVALPLGMASYQAVLHDLQNRQHEGETAGEQAPAAAGAVDD